ncbi:uncharacterized protein METZ01_LOCUS370455 [marine metagenome]|uniref:Uncharacterized protein n=1 Tax=marine metagenome TaxID=408172 RepID=A0A382T8F6_9ZZZZ
MRLKARRSGQRHPLQWGAHLEDSNQTTITNDNSTASSNNSTSAALFAMDLNE